MAEPSDYLLQYSISSSSMSSELHPWEEILDMPRVQLRDVQTDARPFIDPSEITFPVPFVNLDEFQQWAEAFCAKYWEGLRTIDPGCPLAELDHRVLNHAPRAQYLLGDSRQEVEYHSIPSLHDATTASYSLPSNLSASSTIPQLGGVMVSPTRGPPPSLDYNMDGILLHPLPENHGVSTAHTSVWPVGSYSPSTPCPPSVPSLKRKAVDHATVDFSPTKRPRMASNDHESTRRNATMVSDPSVHESNPNGFVDQHGAFLHKMISDHPHTLLDQHIRNAHSKVEVSALCSPSCTIDQHHNKAKAEPPSSSPQFMPTPRSLDRPVLSRPAKGPNMSHPHETSISPTPNAITITGSKRYLKRPLASVVPAPVSSSDHLPEPRTSALAQKSKPKVLLRWVPAETPETRRAQGMSMSMENQVNEKSDPAPEATRKGPSPEALIGMKVQTVPLSTCEARSMPSNRGKREDTEPYDSSNPETESAWDAAVRGYNSLALQQGRKLHPLGTDAFPFPSSRSLDSWEGLEQFGIRSVRDKASFTGKRDKLDALLLLLLSRSEHKGLTVAEIYDEVLKACPALGRPSKNKIDENGRPLSVLPRSLENQIRSSLTENKGFYKVTLSSIPETRQQKGHGFRWAFSLRRSFHKRISPASR